VVAVTDTEKHMKVGHAFNIRLQDPSVHAYAQKHCFLNGPDLALNRALLRDVLQSRVELPEERDAHRIAFTSLAAQRRIAREFEAELQVPPDLGLRSATVRAWIENLGWKVRAIPRTAKHVLVLGSASCREALLIRQHLPEAEITCSDFEDGRLPNVERALGIDFVQGDFHELLAARAQSVDCVFSNHVLEHLFDPDRTLAAIKRALRPAGCMVAALPLDGQSRTPFSSVLSREAFHALDLCTVDVAHAWKTNVSALSRSLKAAGFDQIAFSGRDQHYSVSERVFARRSAFERRTRLGLLLNRALFESVRYLLKKAFPEDVPPFLLKAVFGIEHRVWFGSNRLKNECSVECLVVAR
jgi:ubiquinone/menaquinone biosynthesis C-methylase UbiE